MCFAGSVEVLASFTRMVRRPETEIDLARAALLIARGRDPTVRPRPWLDQLDRFATGVTDLTGLCGRLFDELGFEGDAAHYSAPENSFLHRVIERRRGIPITLSLVTLEVGRRAGVGLVPIGMPGHFLLQDPETGLYIDSFGATVLDYTACEALFRKVTGAGPEVAFDDSRRPMVGPRTILARMLANLATTYRHMGRAVEFEWALRMSLAIPGVPQTSALDLAEAMAAQGRALEAAVELEDRARASPHLAPAFLQAARGLRARLN